MNYYLFGSMVCGVLPGTLALTLLCLGKFYKYKGRFERALKQLQLCSTISQKIAPLACRGLTPTTFPGGASNLSRKMFRMAQAPVSGSMPMM